MTSPRKPTSNTFIRSCGKGKYKLLFRVGSQVFEINHGNSGSCLADTKWSQKQLNKAIDRLKADTRRVHTMELAGRVNNDHSN